MYVLTRLITREVLEVTMKHQVEYFVVNRSGFIFIKMLIFC